MRGRETERGEGRERFAYTYGRERDRKGEK